MQLNICYRCTGDCFFKTVLFYFGFVSSGKCTPQPYINSLLLLTIMLLLRLILTDDLYVNVNIIIVETELSKP